VFVPVDFYVFFKKQNKTTLNELCGITIYCTGMEIIKFRSVLPSERNSKY